MIITQTGIVDIIPEYNRALRPIFCISEGDKASRSISITVKSGGENFTIPGGSSVWIIGKKTDGTIFSYTCSYAGFTVTFPISEQMSAKDGIVLCELRIINGSDVLGSANFVYWVEPSPIANGSSSESDLNIFEQAIAALGGYEYLTSEVSVLSARMDQFARLPDGSLSTAADAELVDMRVMEDGTTASTAGDAVRDQISKLKGFMVISDPTYIGTDVTSWEQGTLRETNGAPVDSTIRCRTANFIQPKKAQGNLCTISVKDGFKVSYRAYSSSGQSGYDASESVSSYFEGTKDIQIRPTYFYKFIISKVDDSDLTPAEVPSDALAIAYYEQINTTLQAEVNEALSKIYNNAYDPGYSILVGGINTSGGNMSTETRARTQYIKIVPGVSYFLELTNTDYGLVGAYVYGSVAQTSVIRRLTFLDSQHLFFTAEEGENYFRTAFYHVMRQDAQTFTAEEAAGLKEYVNFCNTSNAKYFEKTGTFEFFTVTVDRPLSYGGAEVTDATKQEEVECVLRLPDSYSPIGTPTRLVLACHGASGYVDAANNYWYSNQGWPPFMDSLLAAGYAVFDSNVLPTSYGTEVMGRGIGSPAYINVLKKAYDYIQSNYNVYPQIFAHGTSMGGLGASAFSKAYPELVLAESSFAGRDMSQYINWMRTGYYDSDDGAAKVWGYDTIADLKADKWSHIEGCAPVLSLHKLTNGVLEYPPDRATDFDNWLAYYSSVDLLGRNDAIGEVTAIRPPVPYKTWDSWADNANHTKAKFVLQKAFRANGFIYEVVAYDDYSHDQMCYGKVEDMRNQLLAWYKRWE